jgi:hypothetical protein
MNRPTFLNQFKKKNMRVMARHPRRTLAKQGSKEITVSKVDLEIS